MGYKNRRDEMIKKSNNLKGWELLVRYSNELNNIIIQNKSEDKNYLINIISQMDGKFNSAIKSNNLLRDRTYNRVWLQSMNGLYNVLNKKYIKFNLLSHHSEQLLYIGKLNYNKNTD